MRRKPPAPSVRRRGTPIAPRPTPADLGNDVAQAFLDGKINPGELYDELQGAGLTPEEASEMADLLEQEP